MTDTGGPIAAVPGPAPHGSPAPEIGIVGLGLIGGSMARDLAAAGRTVLAADPDRASLDAARQEGIVSGEIDPAAPPHTVVLAVPVRAAPDWVRRIAAAHRPPMVVTDTGSTKRSVIRAALDAGLEGFVGSHPVAGSHESGWTAARAGLFRDADVWICPTPASPPEAVAAVIRLWRDVGARPRRLDPVEHDRLLARSSHLPQLAATALGLALDRLGVSPRQLGPGGRDTTRLAASDPAMWTDILLDNADQVGPALDALAAEVEALARAMADRDEEDLRTALARARTWKTRP